MSILKQLTKEKSKNDGVPSSILFAVGGLLGGLGTYLFLTEGGAKSRQRIKNKIQNLSAKSCELVDHDIDNEAQSFQQEKEPKADAELTPESKAHNMVSHLKEVNHNKTSEGSASIDESSQ